MILNIFKTKNEGNHTNIPFRNMDIEESPFKSYGDDEIAKLEINKTISLDEFEFLLSIGYGNDLNETILKIIGNYGLITSRQLTIALNKTENYRNIEQRDVHRILQKLTKKSFVKKSHFYMGEDSTNKSSYAVYSLATWGRKILSDMDCLPQYAPYYVKCPAYKQKYTLATTQLMQQIDIFDQTKRYPILGINDTAIRFSAITQVKESPFLVECVRSTTEVYKYLPDRIRRFKNIIENYEEFGFNQIPKLLIIAESPRHANDIMYIFKELSVITKVYYTFDNATSADDIIDEKGCTIMD